jgi:tRNA nucleotidyltransferase (CCA-adding enzyme)
MKYNLKEVLALEINRVLPSKAELKNLNDKTRAVLKQLQANISKFKIYATIFIGGSFAKGTIIHKNKYDVDIFIRFDDKYDESEFPKLMSKIIPKNAIKIHGSRDYFVIKDETSNIELEIIPTLKIKKPEDAKNITDLSYFHVNYVKNKINKSKKLADEIRLAKAFIHCSGCYGAESYIQGFSGYAVELLVIAYGGFVKFIEAIAKQDINKTKIILDPDKKFKNKSDILKQMNESKLLSPIILIDPTYKQRNALAALSMKTFLEFQDYSKRFLKNPNPNFFREKDKEKIFESGHRSNLTRLSFSTDRQSGDIAGTKLKKFSNFLLGELARYFNIKDSEFVYDEKLNMGRFLLALENKKEIVFNGPPVAMKEALVKFKKEHKNIKVIKGKAYAYEKSVDFNKFLNNFLNEKSQVIISMGIKNVEKI